MAKRNIGVILAGGSGTRLGSSLPKQYLQVAGKRVIEHSLAAFQAARRIDEIAVVANEAYLHDVKEMVINNGFTKVKKILAGGAQRHESSLAAIDAYEGLDVNLLFHDSVRPLVTERMINDCIDALERYNAVDTAVATTDTIIEVNDKDEISAMPPRWRLRNSQTPQAFDRAVIKKAYDKAMRDPAFTTTDDCGVVMRYLPDEKIFVVRGETTNIKLTYPEDLLIAEHLLKSRDN